MRFTTTFVLAFLVACTCSDEPLPMLDAGLVVSDAAPEPDAPPDAAPELDAGPPFPPGQRVFCLSDLTWAGCSADRVVCVSPDGTLLDASPACVDPDLGGRGACFEGALEVAGTTWCLDCVTDGCVR